MCTHVCAFDKCASAPSGKHSLAAPEAINFGAPTGFCVCIFCVRPMCPPNLCVVRWFFFFWQSPFRCRLRCGALGCCWCHQHSSAYTRNSIKTVWQARRLTWGGSSAAVSIGSSGVRRHRHPGNTMRKWSKWKRTRKYFAKTLFGRPSFDVPQPQRSRSCWHWEVMCLFVCVYVCEFVSAEPFRPSFVDIVNWHPSGASDYAIDGDNTNTPRARFRWILMFWCWCCVSINTDTQHTTLQLSHTQTHNWPKDAMRFIDGLKDYLRWPHPRLFSDIA